MKRENEEGGASDAATGPLSSQQQGHLASVSPLAKKPRGTVGAAKRKREVASEAPAAAATAAPVHTLDSAPGSMATGSGSTAAASVGGVAAKPTAKRRREATPAPTASVAVDPSLPSADQKDSVLQSLPGLHNVGMPDTAAAATAGPLKGDQKPGVAKRPRKKPTAAAEAGGAAFPAAASGGAAGGATGGTAGETAVPAGSATAVTAVAASVLPAVDVAAGATEVIPKQQPVEKKNLYPSAEEDRMQVEQCVAVGLRAG